MSALDLENRITDPDAMYAALVAAHDGLTPEESAALNARLVLLLVNQIGDRRVVEDALKLAREG